MTETTGKEDRNPEQTDQLPALSRPGVAALRERDENFSDDPLSDTGEFDTTALQQEHARAESEHRPMSPAGIAGGVDVQRLEGDLADLSARWNDVERTLTRLTERDNDTDELRKALAAAEEKALASATSLDEACSKIKALEDSLGALFEQHTQLERAYVEQQQSLATAQDERSDALSALEKLREENVRIESAAQRATDSEGAAPVRSRRQPTLISSQSGPVGTGGSASAPAPEGASDPASVPPPAPPAEPSAPPAMLICFTDEGEARHRLGKRIVTIGRDTASDIRIVTDFASRLHAAIVSESGEHVIEDRGSANGVYVNSIQIDRTALRHGDWITLGETQFLYQEAPEQ